MKIGMVGLGKMGANMTQRPIDKGHQVVAFDLSDQARSAVAAQGAETATSPFARFASRDQDSYTNRLVAALRNQFGGHSVVTGAANRRATTSTAKAAP